MMPLWCCYGTITRPLPAAIRDGGCVIDLNQADYDFLRANGRLGAASGHYFAHLDQPIGIWNYIRIANDIAKHIPAGDLLDWGCGYGQMTYLLQRRGFRVTSFDIGTS